MIMNLNRLRHFVTPKLHLKIGSNFAAGKQTSRVLQSWDFTGKGNSLAPRPKTGFEHKCVVVKEVDSFRMPL